MKKIPLIQGFGEYAFYKKKLGKYFDVRRVNWNTSTITPPLKGEKILAGFSMGAIEACEYARKHVVDTLILCSMTPGTETLKGIKARSVQFIVGEKEKWVLHDILRVAKTLSVPWGVSTIKNCGHEMTREYIKKVLDFGL